MLETRRARPQPPPKLCDRSLRAVVSHFLDDDDSVSDEFIPGLNEFSAQLEDVDFIITDLVVNVESQAPHQKQIIDRDLIASTSCGAFESIDGDLFRATLKGQHLYFNSANAVINRKVFDRYRFHSEIKKTADWLFYLEVSLQERIKAIYFPNIFAVYNVHLSSMSIASDKSYWNMRAFEQLHAVVPKGHPSHADVRRAYGKALFDAGYADRLKHKPRALYYYCKSTRYGPPAANQGDPEIARAGSALARRVKAADAT
ncbi:MAG: hypothetical protein IPN75_15210 [Dechloromonas sp.]|uniref:Uncharacterized protein n=1 Tax=Candidatus Dechloromonas phosphorivorans TaxID=2899244 RepID=A0A9D7QIP8_9RHOO|nr:hypothetical protein [Candidatus Dechloromonas phosphorivorans]